MKVLPEWGSGLVGVKLSGKTFRWLISQTSQHWSILFLNILCSARRQLCAISSVVNGRKYLPHVQHVIMMLKGMCLARCCCSRWRFMILWGVPQQCHCLANTFPPYMTSLCVILQTGSSWISFYSLQDHLIFNILLWLLTVTLPCRAGGQLAEIPWERKCQGNVSFLPLQKLPWKDGGEWAGRCKESATVVLALQCCCKCSSLFLLVHQRLPQFEQFPKKSL